MIYCFQYNSNSGGFEPIIEDINNLQDTNVIATGGYSRLKLTINNKIFCITNDMIFSRTIWGFSFCTNKGYEHVIVFGYGYNPSKVGFAAHILPREDEAIKYLRDEEFNIAGDNDSYCRTSSEDPILISKAIRPIDYNFSSSVNNKYIIDDTLYVIQNRIGLNPKDEVTDDNGNTYVSLGGIFLLPKIDGMV